jgi:hypothetical protein
LFSIAPIEDFDITQFDVKTTFLYGEIYMDQPIGFVDKTNPTIVYKLKFALYGSCQAMKAWNQSFNNFLTTYGLSCSDVDSCVYFCEDACLLIAIFINVGLVYNPKITQVDDILIHIGKTFTIVKGMFDVCVSLHITKDQARHCTQLDQTRYILKTLEKFDYINVHGITIPTYLNAHLNDATC